MHEPDAAALYRDLADFIRYGKLDAYELTDEDLARLLEVWRWHVWHAAPDDRPAAEQAVTAAVRDLQRGLAQRADVETEYNTAILLKTEIAPLLHVRHVRDGVRSLLVLVQPRSWLGLVRALRDVRRWRRLPPVTDGQGGRHGYPRDRLAGLRRRAPDLLRRKYWRPISPHTYEERKRSDEWW